MRWCPKGEEFDNFEDGPTVCFIQSLLCELVNLFFIAIFCYRISVLVQRVTFDFIEDQTRLLLRIFQVLVISQAVLSTAFGLSQGEGYVAAFYVLTEVICWFTVFAIVTLEVWKIQRWPWIIIKVYLGFSFFADIMISSVVLHDESSSNTEAGIISTQLVLDIGLLAIALFKDVMRSADDLAKEELKRYSVEFLGSAPVRRNQGAPQSTFTQLWNFFRAKEDEEGLSGREIRLRSSAAETKRWSLFGSGKKSPEDEFDHLVKNQNTIGDDNEDLDSSFRSSFNSQRMSVVESAIERNSLGSNGSGGSRHNRDNSLLRSLFSGLTGGRYARISSDEDKDLEKTSPLLANDHHAAAVGEEIKLMKEEGTPRYIPTKVINRVFEENRAKISASNPVLEPRGSETSIVFTTYTETSRNTIITSPSKGDSSGPPKNQYSDSEMIKYMISVQRWGIRKQKKTSTTNTPDPSTSSTPLPFEAAPALEKVKSLDNLTNDYEPTVYERPKAEIEFEIDITAQLLFPGGKADGGGPGGGEKDWHDFGSHHHHKEDKTQHHWTVWRTALEVHKLHSVMVLQYGDLTPRPPRLVSAVSNSTNFTHTELISDMRSITIFLNALLRLKEGMTVKALIEFLELEKAKVLFVQPDLFKSTTSQDPNDRLDILSSRNSETQESITGTMTEIESRTGRGGEIMSGSNSPKAPASVAGGNMTTRSSMVHSLMDVAELDAANNPNNQVDKWRKLFYQMRIKLKPHDIAVRCRQFEGVISGGEIAAWLIRSTSATGADAIITDQQASNRSEACAIGQELVKCGLITAVCLGFADEDHDHDDLEGYDFASHEYEGGKKTTGKGVNEERFSDLPGYIFRLPVKSGTAGSWSLFGAPITVKIPMMTMADENESYKSTRDTVVLTIDNGMVAADTEMEPAATTSTTVGGHVKYVIEIKHGDDSPSTTSDTWQTTKRYREFEALHKSLLKEGVRPEAPLPSKSYVNALVRPVGFAKATLDETRRAGLETYLSSAVQAVFDQGNEKAQIILAQFLDDEFHNLRLVNSDAPATSTSTSNK